MLLLIRANLANSLTMKQANLIFENKLKIVIVNGN
jgi:hypothetical protein